MEDQRTGRAPSACMSIMVFNELEQAALKEDHAYLLHAWNSLALHKPHKFRLFNLEEVNSSLGQVLRARGLRTVVSLLPVVEELRFELVSLFLFAFHTRIDSPLACS